MCCSGCSLYDSCKNATVVRVHAKQEGHLPLLHFHLCRPGPECDFDCTRCGRLIKHLGRLPVSALQLGCCRKCANYKTCHYADRHMQEVQHLGPEDSREASSIPRADQNAGEHAIRLLLVSSDSGFLARVQRHMEEHLQCIVRVSRDGADALQRLNEFKPSVVIADVLTSGVNGYEVLRHIRQSPRWSNVAVLLVTSFSTDEIDDLAARGGADGCFSKFSDLRELQREVERLAEPAMENRETSPAPEERSSEPPGEVQSVSAPRSRKEPGEFLSGRYPKGSFRVLLVDTDDTFLDAADEVFGGAEVFAVHKARDGLEALKKMTVVRPHAVVLNVNLPKVSGFELCHKLRSWKPTARTPIIALSERGLEQDIGRARGLGANLCIKKPVNLEQLRAAVWTQAQVAAHHAGKPSS